jgi:hypothetical protein
MILNRSDYFRIADEFIKLTQLFKRETVIENLNFWIDMVIHPLLTIGSVLFLKQNVGMFTVLTIHKTITKWQQYARYLQLSYEMNEWKQIVGLAGGPFISTNDSTYHMYVYADGMQRLYNQLFAPLLLTKKRSKRL